MEISTICVQTKSVPILADIYQQEESLCMGSPFSSLIAIIYTQYIEEIFLETSLLKPTLCQNKTLDPVRKEKPQKIVY